MTDQIVPVENTSVEYSPGSPTTVFTIPFRFFSQTDIKVAVADGLDPESITDYVLTTDFTVQGVAVDGGFNGGTVTLNASITTPKRIKIYRDLTIQRTTNFPVTGPFDIEELNTDLNKAYAIMQNLLREVQNHFVKLESNEFFAVTNNPWNMGGRPVTGASMQTTPDGSDLITKDWATANLGGFVVAANAADIDAGLATDEYVNPDALHDSQEFHVLSGSFTPAYAGFSADPTSNPGTVENKVYWRRFGRFVILGFDIGDGTSNSNNFEITNLPAEIQPTEEQVMLMAAGKDNGALLTTPMLVNVQAGPTIRFGINSAQRIGGGWTASGSKGIKNSTTSSANLHIPTIMYRLDAFV